VSEPDERLPEFFERRRRWFGVDQDPQRAVAARRGEARHEAFFDGDAVVQGQAADPERDAAQLERAVAQIGEPQLFVLVVESERRQIRVRDARVLGRQRRFVVQDVGLLAHFSFPQVC
jgi:hypothetical protein